MSEISTVAIITAKPGSGTEVERVLRDLAVATHAEPGCLLYSLQQGMRDPDVFVTVEKWDSMESLESHLASDHLASTRSSPDRGPARHRPADHPRAAARGRRAGRRAPTDAAPFGPRADPGRPPTAPAPAGRPGRPLRRRPRALTQAGR